MFNNRLSTEQKIDVIYNKLTNNFDFLDVLNVASLGFGYYNSYLNHKQIDNNTLAKEINRQNTDYLEKIIKMLTEIIIEIKERKTNDITTTTETTKKENQIYNG